MRVFNRAVGQGCADLAQVRPPRVAKTLQWVLNFRSRNRYRTALRGQTTNIGVAD
jgi:hypothetical protein